MPPTPQNNHWPMAHDWSAAVQNPHISFSDAFLKGAQPAVDRLGMPVVSAGNFAYVFKLVNGNTSKAVRCFSRFVADRQQRYEAIAAHLDVASLPEVVAFDYDATGIRVNGSGYPLLVMEWLNGDALDVYIAQVVTKREVLTFLADAWVRLVSQLEAAKVAHGDLQHGNVLVCNGQLRLVDLDGMFVPALRGRPAIENGHPAYQHPKRTDAFFDERIDRFSALVIFVSLKALAVEPSLWQKFHDENLIFTKQDFLQPRSSPAFKACRALGGEIAPLIEALACACEGQPESAPPLSTFAKATTSKLPDWMRPVPPGSLTSGPRTREVGVGQKVAETSPPSYGTTVQGTNIPFGAAPAPRVSPPAVAPPSNAPSPQNTPSWGERFGAGFGSIFGALWWLAGLTIFSGNIVFMLFAWGGLLLLAIIVGFGTAAAPPPKPYPSRTFVPTAYPAPASSPRPSAPYPAPTVATPSGSGMVIGSRVRSTYHRPHCSWALKISRRNRIEFNSASAARSAGYRPCGSCRP